MGKRKREGYLLQDIPERSLIKIKNFTGYFVKGIFDVSDNKYIVHESTDMTKTVKICPDHTVYIVEISEEKRKEIYVVSGESKVFTERLSKKINEGFTVIPDKGKMFSEEKEGKIIYSIPLYKR